MVIFYDDKFWVYTSGNKNQFSIKNDVTQVFFNLKEFCYRYLLV